MEPAVHDDVLGLDRGIAAEPAAPEPCHESPLSQDEIEVLRAHLQQMREWLVQSLAQMEAATGQQVSGSRMVAMDGNDVAWQNAITQRAIADRRLLLNEIMRAFERIKDNTYGRCVEDNVCIPRSLLEEVPWARFCTSCASRQS